MPGRFIGEVSRTCYDVLHYAKDNNLPGLLLLIDFEKAFDSVSHSMIIKSLHFFGFKEGFIKWVNLLLNSTQSLINLCGNLSPTFNIGRGCRQGDPISALLFIICVEILAIKIRTSTNITGFTIGGLVHCLDMYADDVTVYMDGTASSLSTVIEDL